MEQGVERDVNLDSELMRVVAELLDILDGIACRSPCSEAWSPDVDGICTMIYGCDSALEVASRGEELNIIHLQIYYLQIYYLQFIYNLTI